MDKCPEQNQGVQRCPPERKKMDKCPTVELGVFTTHLKKIIYRKEKDSPWSPKAKIKEEERQQYEEQ